MLRQLRNLVLREGTAGCQNSDPSLTDAVATEDAAYDAEDDCLPSQTARNTIEPMEDAENNVTVSDASQNQERATAEPAPEVPKRNKKYVLFIAA